jgi:hypothetical protein
MSVAYLQLCTVLWNLLGGRAAGRPGGRRRVGQSAGGRSGEFCARRRWPRCDCFAFVLLCCYSFVAAVLCPALLFFRFTFVTVSSCLRCMFLAVVLQIRCSFAIPLEFRCCLVAVPCIIVAVSLMSRCSCVGSLGCCTFVAGLLQLCCSFVAVSLHFCSFVEVSLQFCCSCVAVLLQFCCSFVAVLKFR